MQWHCYCNLASCIARGPAPKIVPGCSPDLQDKGGMPIGGLVQLLQLLTLHVL